MITSSDKTFNAFFLVSLFNCFFCSPGMQSTFSQTLRLSTKTTHELVAFVWLLLGAQLESAVREVRQRQRHRQVQCLRLLWLLLLRVLLLHCCCCCLSLCCCCCYCSSLPPTHTHTHKQQPELTTAFILGHFACCVRTLAIVRLTRRFGSRSCVETGLRANKTKISLPPRSTEMIITQ